LHDPELRCCFYGYIPASDNSKVALSLNLLLVLLGGRGLAGGGEGGCTRKQVEGSHTGLYQTLAHAVNVEGFNCSYRGEIPLVMVVLFPLLLFVCDNL
jgi:hypothetical protein